MNAIWAIAGLVLKELFRRKDFYVLLVLTGIITLAMGSVNFFNDPNIARYLKEICLLLIWASSVFIAVGLAARQLPAEREQRTIFPLLAKPVSRAQVILGKFLGCWLSLGLALTVFYVFFGVIAATREHSFPALNYSQALVLHWMFTGVVIGMVLLGSLVFAAPSSNGTICLVVIIGILLLGRHLVALALQQPEPVSSVLYGLYYAMPHLEFFDVRDLLVHNRPLIPWWAVGAACLYALAYTATFLGAAWLVFRRKPLSV